jgi:hypothetical protein
MDSYQDRRLQELQNMSADEAAACKIRKSTPPRVKAVILRAREQVNGVAKSPVSKPKKLKDGDILLMHNSGTFWQNVISKFTKSPYTHAAVYADGKIFDSLNSAGGLKNKGGNVNTFENFVKRDKGLTYDVFRPRDEKAAQEAARNVRRVTQSTKGYSNANAIQAGLRDRFGFGITANYDKNYKICSELVYDCFNGLLGNEASSSVSPGRLAKNQHLEKVDTLRLSMGEDGR